MKGRRAHIKHVLIIGSRPFVGNNLLAGSKHLPSVECDRVIRLVVSAKLVSLMSTSFHRYGLVIQKTEFQGNSLSSKR